MALQRISTVRIESHAREELIEVTAAVQAIVAEARGDGVATVFVPHTSAAVTINENADPDVQRDMLAWLARLVPKSDEFAHTEGNSDAHIKASLVGSAVQVPFLDGRLRLGTWQGIYFCEFDGPRRRTFEVFVQR
jgi:secondary thiamine-phosphate synthase enzyme